MKNILGTLILITAISANSESKRPTTATFVKLTATAVTVGRLCERKGAELSAPGKGALLRMVEAFGSPEKLFSTAEWKKSEAAAMDLLDEYGCEKTISAIRQITREDLGVSFLEH